MKPLWIIISLLAIAPVVSRAQTLDSIALEQIDNLIDSSTTFRSTSQFDTSLELALAAKKIALEQFGEKTVIYARTLSNLGLCQEAKGEYDSTEVSYLEALKVFEEVAAPENSYYLKTKNNLGIIYIRRGKYQLAKIILNELKDTKARIYGKHLEYATTLSNLSIVYWHLEQYDSAKYLREEVLQIQKKELTANHPAYLSSLNGLAIIYSALEQLEDAERMFLEVLTITENSSEIDSANYADYLNNIGHLYNKKHQYWKADHYYSESKKIKERIFDPEHPSYASTLTNMAQLYSAMGRYEQALELGLQVKEIWEKTIGNKHPRYIANLSTLGYVNMSLEKYPEAEQWYLQAKEKYEKRKETEGFQYLSTLGDLGELNMRMKRYKEAESYYLQQKGLFAAKGDSISRVYIIFLYNLGILYEKMERYDQAELLLQKAKLLFETSTGTINDGYTTILEGCIRIMEATKQREKAIPYIKEANAIFQKIAVNASAYLSEEELFTYFQLFSDDLDTYYSHALVQNNKELNGLLYTNTLFYKGFLLENARQLLQFSYQADEATRQLLNHWKSIRRRLSNEHEKLLNERGDVDQLDEEAKQIEKELIRKSATFAKARQEVNWQDVCEHLPDHAAAVEFIHFNYKPSDTSASILYCALVQRKEYEYPKLVLLFEEKQLEHILRQNTGNAEEYVGLVYLKPDLYQLIWDPLDSLLAGVERIYYSPSGLLHRVSFPAIIQQKSGPVLADRYDLQYVSSSRELVTRNEKLYGKDIKTGIILGGIRYESDSLKMVEAQQTTSRHFEKWSSEKLLTDPFQEPAADSYIPILERISDDAKGTRGEPQYLPGSLTELEKTEKIFASNHISTLSLSEYEASEESFKRIGQDFHSPDVMIASTHGFFFPDPVRKKEGNDQPNALFDTPLFRSGLLLAGALNAWGKKPLVEGFEDGILYAYEVAHMNLSKTKLVVLSACETGLGDIQGSEGVYGLQRAFKLAGVEHIIMSLWKISDDPTVNFMETFYQNWFSDEQLDIRDAFSRTQQIMREKFPDNPYYWAAFVLI